MSALNKHRENAATCGIHHVHAWLKLDFFSVYWFDIKKAMDWITCVAQSCLGDPDLRWATPEFISPGCDWHQAGGKRTAHHSNFSSNKWWREKHSFIMPNKQTNKQKKTQWRIRKIMQNFLMLNHFVCLKNCFLFALLFHMGLCSNTIFALCSASKVEISSFLFLLS